MLEQRGRGLHRDSCEHIKLAVLEGVCMKCFHVTVKVFAAGKILRRMLESIAAPNEVMLPLQVFEPVMFGSYVEVLILAIIENTDIWTEIRNNMISSVLISSDPFEVHWLHTSKRDVSISLLEEAHSSKDTENICRSCCRLVVVER